MNFAEASERPLGVLRVAPRSKLERPVTIDGTFQRSLDLRARCARGPRSPHTGPRQAPRRGCSRRWSGPTEESSIDRILALEDELSAARRRVEQLGAQREARLAAVKAEFERLQ